jgi:phosphoadenosine phosphosulfate reductase
MQTLLSPGAIDDLNARFEQAHPLEILRWAFDESGLDRIAIASAFQAEGTAIIHMATLLRPDVPVLFLETGFQFAETLAFKEQLIEQLRLNVVDLVGEYTVEEQAARFGERTSTRGSRPSAATRRRRGPMRRSSTSTSSSPDASW